MKKLKIVCPRAYADEVEEKLMELDKDAQIKIVDNPKLTGLVEALSIVASISTIAASSFVIWAELERRQGKDIRTESDDNSINAE